MSTNNPNDWVPYYQPSISDAAVAGAATTSSQFGGSSSVGGVLNLSPEGGVSKPNRRRPRASRRIPTTLLNTDTANFRAMVQQFTGTPTAPFGSTAIQQHELQNISFRLGPRTQAQAPFNDAYYQYQQQQQQQFQRNQPQFMVSGNPEDVFFQRIGNPTPDAPVSRGFLVEGVTSDVAAAARIPPNSSSNGTRSNTFLY